MMGEMARRYPPYSLLVSTGTYAGSAESDTDYLQASTGCRFERSDSGQ